MCVCFGANTALKAAIIVVMVKPMGVISALLVFTLVPS